MQTLESGIVAVDITDLNNPVFINKYTDLDGVSAIAAYDDLLYVTDSTRGLIILNKPQISK
jgi:hypothetical protein